MNFDEQNFENRFNPNRYTKLYDDENSITFSDEKQYSPVNKISNPNIPQSK
jgi:hypothetical protein